MKQYIDKAALVAEIEKRKKETESNCGGYKSYDEHRCDSCIVGFYEEFLEILDTLEVKEVDLENSVKGRIDYPLIGVDFPNIYPNYKELKDYCDKNGIKDEDKVKIIIIKDDIL